MDVIASHPQLVGSEKKAEDPGDIQSATEFHPECLVVFHVIFFSEVLHMMKVCDLKIAAVYFHLEEF